MRSSSASSSRLKERSYGARRFDIAKLRLKSPLLHGEIRPTNDAVTPKQRHCVIARACV